MDDNKDIFLDNSIQRDSNGKGIEDNHKGETRSSQEIDRRQKEDPNYGAYYTYNKEFTADSKQEREEKEKIS